MAEVDVEQLRALNERLRAIKASDDAAYEHVAEMCNNQLEDIRRLEAENESLRLQLDANGAHYAQELDYRDQEIERLRSGITELRERLGATTRTLTERGDAERSLADASHLYGKAQGVDLARGFVDELLSEAKDATHRETKGADQ